MSLAFGPGGVVAIADGPELLVYQAIDGAPMWKHFCDGILVGVAIVGDRLVTLDTEGTLTWWRLADGQQEDSTDLGASVSHLVAAPDGAVGAITPNGIVMVSGNTLSIPQVSAASFGPTGASIGVGTHSGAFSAIDPVSGAAWGTVELGAAVTGVAWSAQGHWIVTAANRIAVVSGDGTEVLASIAGPDSLGQVTTSADGLLAGAIAGTQQIACFELHGHRAIGTIDLRHDIVGVAFGSAAMIGIGIDDGDISLINLFTGRVGRSEPHPGRGRNSWSVKVGVDQGAVRGAVVLNQAGGEPIAKYVPIPDDESGCMRNCLIVVAISTVMCMGCTGCSLLTWFLRSAGVF
jgi:hypothetical protein